jgi:hypothetical protein
METLNNYEKNEKSFFSSISDSEFLFIFFQIKRHGCLKFNYYQNDEGVRHMVVNVLIMLLDITVLRGNKNYDSPCCHCKKYDGSFNLYIPINLRMLPVVKMERYFLIKLISLHDPSSESPFAKEH